MFFKTFSNCWIGKGHFRCSIPFLGTTGVQSLAGKKNWSHFAVYTENQGRPVKWATVGEEGALLQHLCFRTRSPAWTLTAGGESRAARAAPKRHYDEWIITLSFWWRLLIVGIVSIIYGCRSNTKTRSLWTAALSRGDTGGDGGRRWGRKGRISTRLHGGMMVTCLSVDCSTSWMSSELRRRTVQSVNAMTSSQEAVFSAAQWLSHSLSLCRMTVDVAAQTLLFIHEQGLLNDSQWMN